MGRNRNYIALFLFWNLQANHTNACLYTRLCIYIRQLNILLLMFQTYLWNEVIEIYGEQWFLWISRKCLIRLGIPLSGIYQLLAYAFNFVFNIAQETGHIDQQLVIQSNNIIELRHFPAISYFLWHIDFFVITRSSNARCVFVRRQTHIAIIYPTFVHRAQIQILRDSCIHDFVDQGSVKKKCQPDLHICQHNQSCLLS